MARLLIDDFKNPQFDSVLTVENSLMFNQNTTKEILEDIDEFLLEIESLKEAVFFKIRKLKSSLDGNYNEESSKALERLEVSMKSLKIHPLDDSFLIFKKKLDLSENIRVQRILEFQMKLNKSAEPTLKSLLESENQEDSQVLANLIDCNLKYIKNSDSSLFIEYSKKLEEKMLRDFRNALCEEDYSLGKSIFKVLQIIDKEQSLIDSFLMHNNLLKYDDNITPPFVKELDLDSISLERTLFDSFMDHVTKIMETTQTISYKLFGSESKYQEYYVSRIFKTLIAVNLDNFLNVENPGVFLYCLSSAFIRVSKFADYLSSNYINFEYDGLRNQIFEQYIGKAVFKETQLFDQVLNGYLSDAKYPNSFIILKTTVGMLNNLEKVYENMLVVINGMLIRREYFYSKENEMEILYFYDKKLEVLLDKIKISSNDKIENLKKLRHIYSLNTKFFKSKFDSFQEKVLEAINSLLDVIKNTNSSNLKGEIQNLQFGDKYSHKKFISLFKKCIIDAKVLKHANYLSLCDFYIEFTYNICLKHIQKIEISEKTSKNLQIFNDEIDQYISETFKKDEISMKLENLKVVVYLISVDDSKFGDEFQKHILNLEDNERKVILKIRNLPMNYLQ